MCVCVCVWRLLNESSLIRWWMARSFLFPNFSLLSFSLDSVCPSGRIGRIEWGDAPTQERNGPASRVAIAKWYANEAAKLKGLDRHCRHTTTAPFQLSERPARPRIYREGGTRITYPTTTFLYSTTVLPFFVDIPCVKLVEKDTNKKNQTMTVRTRIRNSFWLLLIPACVIALVFQFSRFRVGILGYWLSHLAAVVPSP